MIRAVELLQGITMRELINMYDIALRNSDKQNLPILEQVFRNIEDTTRYNHVQVVGRLNERMINV